MSVKESIKKLPEDLNISEKTLDMFESLKTKNVSISVELNVPIFKFIDEEYYEEFIEHINNYDSIEEGLYDWIEESASLYDLISEHFKLKIN